MKQVMNYNKDNGLLNMIRTDPMINLFQMKKTVYFMLFIICFMSCSNGLDRNEFIIAGNNCQYWYKASPDSFGKTRYYIYFDRKGKRVILEERYCDKKCYIYDCGDVYYEPKWKLKNDTIIIWGIKERKLTIISDSVIVTEDKEHHISDTLYKVTNPQLLKKLKKVPIP